MKQCFVAILSISSPKRVETDASFFVQLETSLPIGRVCQFRDGMESTDDSPECRPLPGWMMISSDGSEDSATFSEVGGHESLRDLKQKRLEIWQGRCH